MLGSGLRRREARLEHDENLDMNRLGTARNIVIVLLIAAAVEFLAGGGRVANTFGAVLLVAFYIGLGYRAAGLPRIPRHALQPRDAPPGTALRRGCARCGDARGTGTHVDEGWVSCCGLRSWASWSTRSLTSTVSGARIESR